MASPTLADLGIGRLFDLVPDPVVVGDVLTGTVIGWNAAADQTFGYTSAEAIGMPLERLVPPELRAAHLAGIASYAAGGGGQLTGGHELVEVPALHADGHQLWVELRLAPIDTPVGSHRYVLAAFRDITARRAAQVEAQRALGEAEAANASLREFLAMAAHDLRSPIAGVAMVLSMFERSWDRLSEVQRRDLLAGARRQTDFVVRLLGDVAEVSAIELHALDPQPELCEVAGILHSVAELSGVEVDIEVAPGMQMYADPQHVKRVLVNLLTNAQKYGRPPITLRAVESADAVTIEVDDHGDGIAPELQPRIFEKFARGPETAGTQGAGLGLAIVAGLLDAVGGSVSYSDRPGGGSRFSCTWPVRPTT